MPRVARGPRTSVSDRPGRLKLLLRRQKRLLRPAAWGASGILVVGLMLGALHSTAPGGTLARLRERLGNATASAGLRVNDVVIHPNQGELIAVDRGGMLRVWDLGENKCIHNLQPEEDTSITSVSVASDATLLCAGSKKV